MFHIKNFLTGQLEFRVQDLPLSCLNKLRNYHITQIRVVDDVIVFQAPLIHGTTIKSLVSNFEYKVNENRNFIRGVNFLLNHLILVVAILTAVTAFFVADMGIYRVRVQCDDMELVPAIYEHLDKLDWIQLTYNQYWTEDRVRLFQEYIVWPSLDIPYASIDFVREFADKLSLKHRRLQKKALKEFNKEKLSDPGWYYDNN